MSSVNWELENEKSCVYPFSPRTLAYFQNSKTRASFGFFNAWKTNVLSAAVSPRVKIKQIKNLLLWNFDFVRIFKLHGKFMWQFRPFWRILILSSVKVFVPKKKKRSKVQFSSLKITRENTTCQKYVYIIVISRKKVRSNFSHNFDAYFFKSKVSLKKKQKSYSVVAKLLSQAPIRFSSFSTRPAGVVGTGIPLNIIVDTVGTPTLLNWARWPAEAGARCSVLNSLNHQLLFGWCSNNWCWRCLPGCCPLGNGCESWRRRRRGSM